MAVFIAVVVAGGFVIAQSSVPAATAKTGDTFQLDLVIQSSETRYTRLDVSNTIKVVESALAKGKYNVDSFFDITYASNIGSSGLDGNTAKASFNVDSFFDLEYEIARRSFPTEMVAMSLTASLGDGTVSQRAIDLVREAVKSLGAEVTYGHVTVLK
jgi:hypothetical protein